MLQIMFVSVINNVDLRNNKKNYRKSFLNFLGAQTAAINLSQVDRDKP